MTPVRIAAPHLPARARHARPRHTRRTAAAVAFTVWSVVWFVVLSRHGGVSWHYFAESGRLLDDFDSSTGGLHLYAARPDLQFGPVSVAAAMALMEFFGPFALVVAQMATAAAGVAALVLVRSLAVDARPGARAAVDRVLFAAALLFVPVWMDLAARFVHLDDVLALVLTLAGLLALRRSRPLVGMALLALAVDAKPWALPFVALVLLVPQARRLRGLGVYAAVVAAAWVPFLAADPRSLGAAGFRIPVDPTSTLAALHLGADGTPGWVRAAQVLMGVALAVMAIRRGRWAAVLLLVVLARLVVDPGTHSYYAAGAVTGALLWDLAGSRSRWPWWTAVAAVAFFALRWVPQPEQTHGWVTLVLFVVAAAQLAVRPASPRTPGTAPSRAEAVVRP